MTLFFSMPIALLNLSTNRIFTTRGKCQSTCPISPPLSLSCLAKSSSILIATLNWSVSSCPLTMVVLPDAAIRSPTSVIFKRILGSRPMSRTMSLISFRSAFDMTPRSTASSSDSKYFPPCFFRMMGTAPTFVSSFIRRTAKRGCIFSTAVMICSITASTVPCLAPPVLMPKPCSPRVLANCGLNWEKPNIQAFQ